MIVFTKHAKQKFALLKAHGVEISEEKVIKTVEAPELLDNSRLPLHIAQSGFDAHRVLRVVFKIERGIKKIITFYPGRRKQYEKK